MQLALKLYTAFKSGSWGTYFATVASEAPYLVACLAHMHFNKARSLALEAYASACCGWLVSQTYGRLGGG